MKRIALFVPGIMGSTLWLQDQLIWPGSLSSLVFKYPYVSDYGAIQTKGDELLSDKLVVRDVIRKFSISSQYEDLFDTLGGFGFREADGTLIAFPYDWRKSNRDAAVALAKRLDEIAGQQSQCEIILIAHSMGGLVSRYYLESGKYQARDGFKVVTALICLATPNLGSPIALTAALGSERRLFLNEHQVYKLASQDEFPSLYELLPPQGTPFAWNRELKQRLGTVDIYSDKVAPLLRAVGNADRKLNLTNLAAAKAFREGLDLSKAPQSVRYFFFAGTRQRNATASLVSPVGNLLEAQNHEVDDGGDGTVPFWSAAMTGIQVAAVGGEHGTIYKDGELRNVLGAVLGARGVAAAITVRAELSVRDHVVDPDGVLHAALMFRAGVEHLTGDIRIEKVDPATGDNKQTMSVSEISYKGVRTERFYLLLKAPSYQGVYRVSFHEEGASGPSATDELFVQASQISPQPLP